VIPDTDFVGAKIALFAPIGGMLCYLRDDFPGLPWPGYWDLPGGGREGDETPETCALRELAEEFGLHLPPARLEWSHRLPSMLWPDLFAWAFGGHLSATDIAAIRFGDEGQRWQVMNWAEFLTNPLVIPAMRDRAVMARLAMDFSP
jgi:8-oxo-dGTP diphosphatase